MLQKYIYILSIIFLLLLIFVCNYLSITRLVFHNSITIENTLNILENRDLPYVQKNANVIIDSVHLNIKNN